MDNCIGACYFTLLSNKNYCWGIGVALWLLLRGPSFFVDCLSSLLFWLSLAVDSLLMVGGLSLLFITREFDYLFLGCTIAVISLITLYLFCLVTLISMRSELYCSISTNFCLGLTTSSDTLACLRRAMNASMLLISACLSLSDLCWVVFWAARRLTLSRDFGDRRGPFLLDGSS